MLVRWSEAEGKCQEATTADSLPSLKAATQPLNVSQAWSRPSDQSSRTSKETSSERLGVCFSALPGQCSGGGSLPRTISVIGTVPWDPGMQSLTPYTSLSSHCFIPPLSLLPCPLATRATRSRCIPWVAATKTTVQDTNEDKNRLTD